MDPDSEVDLEPDLEPDLELPEPLTRSSPALRYLGLAVLLFPRPYSCSGSACLGGSDLPQGIKPLKATYLFRCAWASSALVGKSSNSCGGCQEDFYIVFVRGSTHIILTEQLFVLGFLLRRNGAFGSFRRRLRSLRLDISFRLWRVLDHDGFYNGCVNVNSPGWARLPHQERRVWLVSATTQQAQTSPFVSVERVRSILHWLLGECRLTLLNCLGLSASSAGAAGLACVERFVASSSSAAQCCGGC